MSDEFIARRTALKYFGLLAASAAGREFLAAWLPPALAAERPTPAASLHHHDSAPSAAVSGGPYTPKFFRPEQFEPVEILTELIIPTDDQPGAKEAQVAQYIDFVVFSAAEHMPELQKEWTSGLELLDQMCQQKYGRPFRALAPAEQEHLLLEISLPERDHQAHHACFAFYRLVKEMTVEGFYTSRVGLKDVLGYQGRDFLTEFLGCTHPEHQT